MVRKTYHLFYESFVDFSDEIIAKLNNYLDENMFEKFKPSIFDIIENSLSLLS